MRWSATRAHSASVRSSTTIWLTTSPRDERLEHPREVRAVDAEHRRARADQRVERHDRLVGMLRAPCAAPCGSRCRRRSPSPRGAASTQSRMRSVEPTRSASSTTSCAHSGCTITSTVGVLGAERGDVLGPEALVHRAVTLPQQERRFLDVALLEPAELEARVPHPHVGLVVAHVVAGVAAEVLVGEEQDLDRRRARAPTRGPPARSTTCTPRRRARRRTPSAPRTSSCR